MAFRNCISLLEAAVTKYDRLGSQNTSSLFSHSSGNRKSKIKVLAGLVSREAPPVGAETAIFSLWPHLVFSLCECIPGASLCVQAFFSYKDISQIDLGPTLMTSF